MIYIEGLGYVEEPTSVVMPSSQVKTQETDGTSFDDVLNSITSNSAGTTYTLKQIFQEAASTYGVDEKLLEAVAYRESGFNANATSSSGAQGIMQLMPSTASSLGVTDSYDAYQNIMGGAKLLKQLSDSYNGDLSLTLAAYNAGAGAVKRAGGIPSTSVQNYVTSVLSLYESGVNVPDTTVTTKAASESNNTENNSGNNTSNSTVSNAASSSAAAATTTVTGSSSGTTYIDADTLEAALTSVLGSQSSTSVSSASELAAQVMAALGGTNTSYGISSDWTSQEYQLMLQYYTNMLNTISTFGDTDDDDDDDYGESSLADLYQLGIQQQLGIDTTSTSTTSTATASAIAQAAKAYAAGNSLLDL
jgi:IS1 family transposase